MEGRATEVLLQGSGRSAGRQDRFFVQGHLLHRQLGELVCIEESVGALCRTPSRLRKVDFCAHADVQPPWPIVGCGFLLWGAIQLPARCRDAINACFDLQTVAALLNCAASLSRRVLPPAGRPAGAARSNRLPTRWVPAAALRSALDGACPLPAAACGALPLTWRSAGTRRDGCTSWWWTSCWLGPPRSPASGGL